MFGRKEPGGFTETRQRENRERIARRTTAVRKCNTFPYCSRKRAPPSDNGRTIFFFPVITSRAAARGIVGHCCRYSTCVCSGWGPDEYPGRLVAPTPLATCCTTYNETNRGKQKKKNKLVMRTLCERAEFRTYFKQESIISCTI